jgi:hypothetical protein
MTHTEQIMQAVAKIIKKEGKNTFSRKEIREVEKSENLDFRNAIKWITSVWSFFELGMEKERDGLEPKIYISW